MNDEFFAQVDALTEAGQLRRLSGAFARFIASIGASSPPLMAACVLLSELEGRGHSCLLLSELNADPAALLGWNGDEWLHLRASVDGWPEDVASWRTLLAASEQVWPVGGADCSQPLVLDGDRLYLRRYWQDETHVAAAVRGRALGGVLASDADAETAEIRRWLDILFPHATRGGGVDWQKVACAVAMRGKLGIITGGPGTGKTYTVARLLALLFATAGSMRQSGLRVALAAPTGKAAARLKQSIDDALDKLAVLVGTALPLRELTARMGAARTLHSLLGARPDTRAFQHNAGNQLDVDVLIVDEASMIHLEMMSALLAALPPEATLILLGDKDQLASVEAGAVLGDLCHNAEAGEYLPETLSYVQASTGQQIPDDYAGHGGPIAQQTVMLRESRRFGGPIGELALAVNAGNAAKAVEVLRSGQDGKVAWTDFAQPADMLQLALSGYRQYLQLIKNSIADADDVVRLAILRSFEGFRILCAVRDGEWGVSGLNDAIEQRLQSAGLLKRTGEWYVGRPVMVTRNDYATGVFNGDIGLTLPDPARPGALRVYFSEGETVRSVLATRLRNVETAFAMTVHKSQGSEFAHTAMVLPKDGGSMLARELIYTGITRARDYFTLLTPNGQVLLDAIGQRTQRASGLRHLLDN
ncbi:DNA helicase/exodeoxyribonuclease V, alpha subunit [Duganella sacchari]|uniref:RecBCD enzyme subunit RecD n=1 Tax=Duganella sacchari TaxID=551987 RepID=A0A1M7NZY3_9BURK|nr:exodeoxyribonuclease V subunit alpha [Duganella sacchari]SHN09782.1 DNA helicase/exodeoxyribonuclease V, alpha subunit [Duganella sacchari]